MIRRKIRPFVGGRAVGRGCLAHPRPARMATARLQETEYTVRALCTATVTYVNNVFSQPLQRQCQMCMKWVSMQHHTCEQGQAVLCLECKRERRRLRRAMSSISLWCERPPDASVLTDLGVGTETFRQLQALQAREISPNDYDILMRLHSKPSKKTCIYHCSKT